MTAWKFDSRLPDGHRLFSADGRYAIADNSGRTPEDTDDGVLWLDTERPLIVWKDGGVAITLRTSGDELTRTPSDPHTILLLAARFGWRVQVEDEDYEFEVRTPGQVMTAVNAGADLVTEAMAEAGYLGGDAAYDMANIMACAIGSVLRDPDVSIAGVLAENFQDSAEQWREELGDDIVDQALALQQEARA